MTVQETKTSSSTTGSVNKTKKDKGLRTGNKKKNFTKTVSLKRKKLTVGDICELQITALGPKGIGIDEYSYGYPILVSLNSTEAKLGDKVKAKVLFSKERNNVKKLPKYAIAKFASIVTKTTASNKTTITAGEKVTVKISEITSKGSGIGVNTNGTKIIIPNTSSKLGETIQVIVTRVKENYAFAKELATNAKSTKKAVGVKTLANNAAKASAKEMKEGTKISCVLPQKTLNYGKYFIVKFVKGTVLFIKKGLGAKPGDKVRLQITKATNTYYIANILQLNPISSFKKQSLVKYSVRQMIKNGMHFGEKAVKCHAGMKNYIWLKKVSATNTANSALVKKGRHIINLLKTRRCLNKALNVLGKYALKGRTFLFIGTKKPAAGLIARASLFSQTSFFVNTRWLGGMLTNWKTILKSIKLIRPILKEKQKIIRDILEKRQTVKQKLIKKALLLKKKSKLILAKGQQLVAILKNPSAKANFINVQNQLSVKRKTLLKKNLALLEKRQMLLEKRRELMVQSQILKEKGNATQSRYQSLLTQLVAYTQKLREYKYLLMISKQLHTIKTSAAKNVYSVSYSKLKEFSNNSAILPNPPREILNKIVLTIMSQQTINSTSGSPISAKSTNGQKVLVLSKLLSQFSRFAPYIKTQILNIQGILKNLEMQCQKCLGQLKQLKSILTNYVEFKTKLVNELQTIKAKLTNNINCNIIVKKKLNYFAAQKRLIKLLPLFLPLVKNSSSTNNSPNTQNQISETVQVLMRKIVDPKLKYPIDQIYDQRLSTTSKKVATARKKNWQRLEKYFGGIANMTKLNKANILQNIAIIIGQKEEMNAVRECQKLGIKMFNVVDTNCNPTFADHIIPANDDSRNSIKYILQKFLTRIRLAQKIRSKLLKVQKSSGLTAKA